MMDTNHEAIRAVYVLVYNNLTKGLYTLKNRMNRLLQLNDCVNAFLREKLTLTLGKLTLLFSIVFGLPSIYQGIMIIRSAFWKVPGEMLKNISVAGVSTVIWITIILVFAWQLHKRGEKAKAYEKQF